MDSTQFCYYNRKRNDYVEGLSFPKGVVPGMFGKYKFVFGGARDIFGLLQEAMSIYLHH